MNDPRYPESGAYHEAGHIVVAAAQGMLLSIHGVHVDRDGKGISSCSAAGASEDNDWVGRLLPQMYLGGPSVAAMRTSEVKLNKARQKLRQEASQLVNEHWIAVDTLAKALWAKPLTPRLPDEPEKGWSLLPEEKTIDGAGIIDMLKEFGICVSLLEQ